MAAFIDRYGTKANCYQYFSSVLKTADPMTVDQINAGYSCDTKRKPAMRAFIGYCRNAYQQGSSPATIAGVLTPA